MTTPARQRATLNATSATATAVHRASQPGYPRWLAHVSSVGGCERPIRLTGQLHTINPTTGEVLASRSTETLPDGVLYVPCGDRRSSVCPACAETYRRHLPPHPRRPGRRQDRPRHRGQASGGVRHLHRSELRPVHGRVVDPKTGTVKPCRMRRSIDRCPHGRVLACPQRQAEDSLCVGRPLCSECYDYPAHVVWNGWASELWRRTTIAATRNLRDVEHRYGVKLRLSFAKVAEYQARGLVHFHALIRLDAIDPNDPDAVQPPPAGITARDLDEAITRAVAATRITTPPHPARPSGWTLTWGTQLDIRPVAHHGELTDTAVAGYLAKYATKATEATGHISRRITTETIGAYADYQTHPGTLISVCWELGTRPADCVTDDDREAWKRDYGRLQRWAHMLGFDGHFTTKSRWYSITRQALKAIRRAWRRRHHYHPATDHTAEHVDDDTTLVVGTLTFAGVGYRTIGDHWLALTAAAQARERRQTAKEERKTA